MVQEALMKNKEIELLPLFMEFNNLIMYTKKKRNFTVAKSNLLGILA